MTTEPRARWGRCPNCGGTGVVKCWDPGGPCPVRNEPGCDTCGACQTCGGGEQS